MSPLSKILNIRQYVDGLAIFLFQQVTRKWYEKMAAGVGGLQTALILIGFIVRFQPNFNNNIEVYDVRLENLGFCACQLDIKTQYTIFQLIQL
jgi:hypothetical protein